MCLSHVLHAHSFHYITCSTSCIFIFIHNNFQCHFSRIFCCKCIYNHISINYFSTTTDFSFGHMTGVSVLSVHSGAIPSPVNGGFSSMGEAFPHLESTQEWEQLWHFFACQCCTASPGEDHHIPR